MKFKTVVFLLLIDDSLEVFQVRRGHLFLLGKFHQDSNLLLQFGDFFQEDLLKFVGYILSYHRPKFIQALAAWGFTKTIH